MQCIRMTRADLIVASEYHRFSVENLISIAFLSVSHLEFDKREGRNQPNCRIRE